MNMRRIIFPLFLSFFGNQLLNAYAPVPLSKPYEIPTFLYEKRKQTMSSGFFVEGGSTTIGGDGDGHHIDFLQRYEPFQSTIGMLKTRITDKAKADALYTILTTPGSLSEHDGAISYQANYDQINATSWFTIKLPIDKFFGSFFWNTYLPFTYQSIRNVTFEDQTSNTPGGSSALVKTNITDDLNAYLQEFGSNIKIPNVAHAYGGLGDIISMLEWRRHFPQKREYLIDVLVHAGLGVSIPSGINNDVDYPLMLPNGNRGAWGIPLTAGIDLGFLHGFHCGIDVDFLSLFYVTNTFRLKTDPAQTSLFIPEKGIATLAQGNTWHFNLFGRWERINKTGFYAGLKYQFMTHNEDELYPLENQFDFNVVNSNPQLDEWSAHYFMFSAGYNSAHHKDARVTCDGSLFYKAPIVYKRSILMHTFGAQLTIRF